MLQGEELSAYLRSLPSSKITRIESSTNPNASFGTDGAGGVINIILKSNERTGTFLTTSHSLSYWKNIRQNSDISFSFNKSKWQLGLNYSHSLGHYAMKYGFEKVQDGNKSISETSDTDKRNTYSVGVDFSWQPNQKNKLYFNSTMNLLVGPGLTETTTQVYNGTSTLDGILKARNDYVKQKTIQYNNSINYLYQPSESHQLSFSVDWTHFDSKARCKQPNDYFSSNNILIRSDLFYSQPDKDIDIYALLADYKYKPNAQNEWLIGAKTSLIKSDNIFLFKKNGLIDSQRSNRFKYNEDNIETYVQYTLSLNKLELSTGLRMEYMYTNNKLHSYANQLIEENNRKKLNLFPNMSVSYAFNDNIGTQQQIGLEAVYSKRLTSWWDINSNIGFYYFDNKLNYENYKQEYKRPSCFLSANNNFHLPLGIDLELSGRYYSKRQGGSYEVNKSTGGIDIDLNKSWNNNRFRLSLLMTDLLHTERWDSYGIKDSLSLSSWGYGESRKIMLRFTYSIGKQKFEKEEKNLEELKRL